MQRSGYPISTFAEMLGGKCIQQALPGASISSLLTDSRFYRQGEESAFFAIRSSRNDGHHYVEELASRGLRTFVISDKSWCEKLPGANVILVNDAVEALQKLAAAHRSRFDLPIIAVTGSNGKTVVKEWLFQLLQKHHHVVRSPRSYNSQVGVPLSVWHIHAGHELGIFEAGISMPGEMQKLAKVLRPGTGIFTNIGQAHQENFPSLQAKVEEKIKLFEGAERIIYCLDHSIIHERLQAKYANSETQLCGWSMKQSAMLQVSTRSQANGLLLEGIYDGKARSVALPFSDAASLENACHCWLYMLLEGYRDEDISEGFKALTPIAMRLEQRDGVHGSTLISDVYNSDFNSLEIAIDQLMLQRKHPSHTAIISDLVQTGENPGVLYARLASLLRSKGLHKFVGIGKDICAEREAFTGIDSSFYPDTEAFLLDFRHRDYASQNILVKGARQFAFERITDILSEKTHETILEIDLERIRENLNYIRSLLHRDTGIMVMVKAFAYGSGAYEVARTLEFHGVQYLAVAYADEGITLREAGIKIPILVLNPEVSSYDAMIRYRLEPQIYNFRTLERFTDALFAREGAWPYPIHIKINTGMNRLGFDLAELDTLSDRLSANGALQVETVFSHLAASESTEYDELSSKQIARFEEAVASLRMQLKHPFRCHLLNSQGIFRFPERQYDYVRLGLALYGVSGNKEFRAQLKPVSRLISTISQLRLVPAGEGIGYSPKAMLTEATRIAIIPIGYADGLPRALGNGKGHVLIRGQRCPFAGNICMDMAMVEVGNIPCEEGDQVEVFGDHMDIYEMAKNLNTIPYEVLTNISQRVKRIYLHQ